MVGFTSLCQTKISTALKLRNTSGCSIEGNWGDDAHLQRRWADDIINEQWASVNAGLAVVKINQGDRMASNLEDSPGRPASLDKGDLVSVRGASLWRASLMGMSLKQKPRCETLGLLLCQHDALLL